MFGNAESSIQGRARVGATKGALFSMLKGARFGLEPAPDGEKAESAEGRKAPQFAGVGARA